MDDPWGWTRHAACRSGDDLDPVSGGGGWPHRTHRGGHLHGSPRGDRARHLAPAVRPRRVARGRRLRGRRRQQGSDLHREPVPGAAVGLGRRTGPTRPACTSTPATPARRARTTGPRPARRTPRCASTRSPRRTRGVPTTTAGRPPSTPWGWRPRPGSRSRGPGGWTWRPPTAGTATASRTPRTCRAPSTTCVSTGSRRSGSTRPTTSGARSPAATTPRTPRPTSAPGPPRSRPSTGCTWRRCGRPGCRASRSPANAAGSASRAPRSAWRSSSSTTSTTT